MANLTSRRQYETGSNLQVFDPSQLELFGIIQIDSIRKPRPKIIRLTRAIGSFLTAGETGESANRRQRGVRAWQQTGVLTEAATRGIIISLTETSLSLQVRGFDFDPEHPARPMVSPPVTTELTPVARPPRQSDFASYEFQDIGLIAIRPPEAGHSNYHTNDDIGRFSLALVHRMFEPIEPAQPITAGSDAR